MLITMSDKELKRLSVLQEICDQRITQSQATSYFRTSDQTLTAEIQSSRSSCISPYGSWPNQQFQAFWRTQTQVPQYCFWSTAWFRTNLGAWKAYSTGVMVHSDQGSQYCSRAFRALLLTNNCIQSMSRSLAQYTAHVGTMQWLKASFIHWKVM